MLDVKCVTRKLWSDPISKSFSARIGNLLVRFLYSRPEMGTFPDSRKASYSPMFLGKGVGKGWTSSCAHSPADLSTTSPAGVHWWGESDVQSYQANSEVNGKEGHTAMKGCGPFTFMREVNGGARDTHEGSVHGDAWGRFGSGMHAPHSVWHRQPETAIHAHSSNHA